MTEDRAPEDRIASFRANYHRALAALEVAGAYRHWQDNPLPPDAEPERNRKRLTEVLCGIRHLADQFHGLRFHQIRSDADELYRQPGTAAPASSAGAGAAALRSYELMLSPVSQPGPVWPLDTLAGFDNYADSRGISRETAVTWLISGLFASLRQYADHQGLDFGSAMTAGLRAHAQQCLDAYGPIDTGLIPDRRPAVTLSPSRAGPPFEPIVTHQGVVTTLGDAEWLLIRTAARIEHKERYGRLTRHPDLDDRRALTKALASACGLPEPDVLSQLSSKITARSTEIEHGPAEAARLGHEHGRAGTEPYCDLDIDGDATALLSALGETEWMTDANHGYRVSLVIAYADAYKQASRNGPPAAGSPVRIAARDFPARHLPSPQPGAPAPPHAASTARANPRPGPERRSRRRT